MKEGVWKTLGIIRNSNRWYLGQPLAVLFFHFSGFSKRKWIFFLTGLPPRRFSLRRYRIKEICTNLFENVGRPSLNDHWQYASANAMVLPIEKDYRRFGIIRVSLTPIF